MHLRDARVAHGLYLDDHLVGLDVRQAALGADHALEFRWCPNCFCQLSLRLLLTTA